MSGPPIENDEYVDVAEACRLVGVSQNTLRAAIKSGSLPAFIPRGRDPMRAGAGHGYRISKADLTAWYGLPHRP